ncbi:MAG: hypothetical protein KGI57_03635 [Hyphomicrobiales bacterium]|nr:hypothetical protein [Hyphomicrobiales bacterium]MDE2016778.1 hypothetical protein [Hyphomicrobiales bacterium]
MTGHVGKLAKRVADPSAKSLAKRLARPAALFVGGHVVALALIVVFA